MNSNLEFTFHVLVCVCVCVSLCMRYALLHFVASLKPFFIIVVIVIILSIDIVKLGMNILHLYFASTLSINVCQLLQKSKLKSVLVLTFVSLHTETSIYFHLGNCFYYYLSAIVTWNRILLSWILPSSGSDE